jgi:hypothetical protein
VFLRAEGLLDLIGMRNAARLIKLIKSANIQAGE